MTKAKKMSLLISLILIIVEVVVLIALGFNYNLSYGNAKRIIISMDDEFELKDYKNMAKEVYGSSKVEAISVFNNGVSIKVKDTNDEQLDSLIQKINEKYGYEYTVDDLKVTDLPKVEVFDILKPLIVPVLTSLLIILAYMIIRYRKVGLVSVILNLFIPVIIGQLTVLSIYLIFRIPVTNVLLPVMLVAYVASVLYSANNINKDIH